MEQDWGGIVWSYADEGQSIAFGGATHNLLEFMQAMKPLDLFSKSDAMLLLMEARGKDSKVLLAQDHFADVESSRITNFNSYLEFVLHHWGLVGERRKFYSEYGGHQRQMLIAPAAYWKERPRPDLESLY